LAFAVSPFSGNLMAPDRLRLHENDRFQRDIEQAQRRQ
jgi:hypothetical protein